MGMYRVTISSDDLETIEEYSFEDKIIAISISKILSKIPKHTVHLAYMQEDSLGRLRIDDVDFQKEMSYKIQTQKQG